jgi:hypothetical protein
MITGVEVASSPQSGRSGKLAVSGQGINGG